jgi:hypothetical protein
VDERDALAPTIDPPYRLGMDRRRFLVTSLAGALAAPVAAEAQGPQRGNRPATVLFSTRRREIADLAAKHRLPAIYGFRGFVDDGGLMSYGLSLPGAWRQAAGYVDKILKGARPGELPVEQATKFEMVINLKTAKALGLTIPPSLLARADQVIE